jgi:carbohydrate kinase (thermoresistant glucokinase family)
MKKGIPFQDSDRLPWLQVIRDNVDQWIADHRNVVLACSALKRIYRETLCISPEVKLVYLKGTIPNKFRSEIPRLVCETERLTLSKQSTTALQHRYWLM